ncbi:MAG: GntR family transcriptional regulator [Acidimicrobiales bacterium]
MGAVVDAGTSGLVGVPSSDGTEDHGPRPLYQLMAGELRSEIRKGVLRPDDRLPSERELSDRFGASRMTARQALHVLCQQGYAYRHARKGSFVRSPVVQFSAGSFTRTIIASGRLPGAEVLEAVVATADPDTAVALGIEPGAPVYFIERLRSVDGGPTTVENIYLPQARFPDLLSSDLSKSLWDVLQRRYGVRASSAIAHVNAVLPRQRHARLLGVAQNTPALLLSRTVLDEDGLVMEHARDLYPGDRSRFQVRVSLTGPGDGGTS